MDPSKTTTPFGLSGIKDLGSAAGAPLNRCDHPAFPKKWIEGDLSGVEVEGMLVFGSEALAVTEASSVLGGGEGASFDALTVATPSVSISYKLAPTATVSSLNTKK